MRSGVLGLLARGIRTRRVLPRRGAVPPRVATAAGRYAHELRRLIQLEQNERLPTGARILGAMEIYLGTLEEGENDMAVWDNVGALAQCSVPPGPQLDAVLTKLEHLALSEPHRTRRKHQVLLAGDLAYRHGKLAALDKLCRAYMDAVSHTNPYRAIELWNKDRGRLGPLRGISFYIRANQLQKAEQLASETVGPAFSPALCREFLLAYASRGDQTAVDKWLDRLQAPDVGDVEWILHILSLYRLSAAKLSSFTTTPRRTYRPRTTGQQKTVIALCNKLLAAHPAVLSDRAGYELWAKLVLSSDSALVLKTVDLVASIDKLRQGELHPLLKRLPVDDVVALFGKMDSSEDGSYPAPTAVELCTIIHRVGSSELPERAVLAAKITERMRYLGCLFDRGPLSAVCQARPVNLLDIAFEALDRGVHLDVHQLLEVWQEASQRGSHLRLSELWAATASHPLSYAVLRAALYAFVGQKDFVSAAVCLYNFQVEQRFVLDDRFTDSVIQFLAGETVRPVKLPRPVQQSNPSVEKWVDTVKRLCRPFVVPEWVVQKALERARTSTRDTEVAAV